MSLVLPAQPFVGLRPFDRADSLLFFGRGEQTTALLQRLHRSHFLAIVGTSGSGKSSLVRAGLIPKLEAGFLVEDRDRWMVAKMKPGNAPVRHLAEAIASAGSAEVAPDAIDRLIADIRRRGVQAIVAELQMRDAEGDLNTLLLVDQFEEVFRLSGNAQAQPTAEAIDLVSIVLGLAAQREVPVYVTLTMRSDFLGKSDAFDGLPEAINDSQYLVPRLTRGQLREAILGPVVLFGESMKPPLVERLLNDVGEAADMLPVLQHALLRTWKQWKTHHNADEIDIESYDAVGGVARALEQHADEALTGKTDAEIDRIRRVFQALTEVDSSNRFVRRPSTVGDLITVSSVSEPGVREIITLFKDDGDRSFLTVSEGKEPSGDLVDISHESLIRQWAKLRRWVEEEAESARIYRRLADAAVLHAHDRAELFHGTDLAVALKWETEQKPMAPWAARYHDGFEQAMVFLRESQTQENARREQEKADADAKLLKTEREAEAERVRIETDRRQKEKEEQRAAELRQTKIFAAVLATLLVLAFGTAAWAVWAQRQLGVARDKAVEDGRNLESANQKLKDAEAAARSALEQTVQALRAQVASGNASLAASAAAQLVTVTKTRADDVVSLIPKANLQSNEWLAALALGLDAYEARNGGPGAIAEEARLRVAVPAAMSRARGIDQPPSPEEEEHFNRRVQIDAGTFMMGSPRGKGDDERPQHRVTLSAFRIQEHEVTNEEYRRFDRSHGRDRPNLEAVTDVSWYDAMAYAFWVGGNLPTEAQWEFAARGPNGRKYPWGDKSEPTCERAQFLDCELHGVHAVKTGRERGKTPEGVYDLAGNVWEWCRDSFDRYHEGEQTDPLGPLTGDQRVLRGGSFGNNADSLRAALRYWGFPDYRNVIVGFRVVSSRLRP